MSLVVVYLYDSDETGYIVARYDDDTPRFLDYWEAVKLKEQMEANHE